MEELAPLTTQNQARIFKDFCSNLDIAILNMTIFSEAANLVQERMLKGLNKASGGHIGASMPDH